MAISEESCHHLYQRLEQVLGSREATVLMEHLPPVGWADVATKRDLDVLEDRVNTRFERVGERFDRMEERLADMDRRWDERFSDLDRRWDERFAGMDLRMQALEWLPREFRSQLFALMSFMAVVLGVVVAAVKV